MCKMVYIYTCAESGSSTFFLFLYLYFLKYYGSIVIFLTFIRYSFSLVLFASPFSSKLVFFGLKGIGGGPGSNFRFS